MRTLALCILACLALAIVPASNAGHDAAASASASTSIAPPSVIGTFAPQSGTLYQHRDCVGPGLPGTAGAHTTHTTNVPGIVGGSAVNFNINALTLFGSPGPCPVTAADAGVLPLDFTGQYHVVAVCRGNVNPGTVFIDWTINFVAGSALGQSSFGNACFIATGSSMSVDVTISISTTTLLGVTLPPTGAIQLTISQ